METRFSNSFDYLGLTFGSEQERRQFIGSYGNWQIRDSVSIYFDAKEKWGQSHYEPSTNAFGFNDMIEAQEKLSQMYLLAVTGFRFEDNFDFRIEYIYNQAGFDSKNLEKAISAATTLTLNFAPNVRRFQKSGLEFLGKHYLYTSLRVPDLGSKNDVQTSLRYFHSLQDNSAIVGGNLETPLSDSTVGYLDFSYALGSENKEFTLTDRSSVGAGARWIY